MMACECRSTCDGPARCECACHLHLCSYGRCTRKGCPNNTGQEVRRGVAS